MRDVPVTERWYLALVNCRPHTSVAIAVQNHDGSTRIVLTRPCRKCTTTEWQHSTRWRVDLETVAEQLDSLIDDIEFSNGNVDPGTIDWDGSRIYPENGPLDEAGDPEDGPLDEAGDPEDRP